MKTRFGAMLVGLAVFISLSIITPVLTYELTTGWTAYKVYEGGAHEVGSSSRCGNPEGPPYNCSFPWTEEEYGTDAYASADTNIDALAVSRGKITYTVVWDWSLGTPPRSIIIRETAGGYWEVGRLVGFGTITSHKGWATNSLGGWYNEQPEDLLTGWSSGGGQGQRYVKVDCSSGSFTRTATMFAGATCSSVGGTNHIMASCYFYIESADGMPFTTIVVDPPGREAAPLDHPVGDDPVNLATGAQSLLLAPDIVSYNPYGPSPAYTRNYHSGRAKSLYASPGLSAGWVDNYDVSITAAAPGTWGELNLKYPNGAEETLTPMPSGGQSTSEFTEPAGAPYFAKGTRSETTGQWQSIEITFGDQSQWTLTPAESNCYRLSKITNRMGRYISIPRDSRKGYRVISITDDSNPVNNLLTFAYSGNFLASVTDAYGRKVAYTFGLVDSLRESPVENTICLLSFSGIVPSQTPSPSARTTYGYTAVGNPARALLTSTTDPSPTGSGTKTDTINYYTDDTDTFSYGKVKSLVDDHGNTHEYIYESNAGTRVLVKNSPESIDPEAEWVANFDPANRNRSTGITDNNNRYTNVFYTDIRHPTKPTISVDKAGKQTIVTYDQYGNILTSKSARGTTTTFTYCYPGQSPEPCYPGQPTCTTSFPLGRLVCIKEGDKPATTFTYFEPTGLVESVTTPKPGAVDDTRVTTWFTYDALGNIKTIKKPGNNAASAVTTVYDYGVQPKLGQPLSVADVIDPTNPSDPGWSRITHFSYDARGNMISATDALGNKVDYTYNVANQPLSTILPATP